MQGIDLSIDQARNRIKDRLDDHRQFVRDRQAAGKAIKHTNQVYGFPVVTRQEAELMLLLPSAFEEKTQNQFQVGYEIPDAGSEESPSNTEKQYPSGEKGQLSLFDA